MGVQASAQKRVGWKRRREGGLGVCGKRGRSVENEKARERVLWVCTYACVWYDLVESHEGDHESSPP